MAMNTSFDKKKHVYLIDGKPATGVTTIIGVLNKPALIGWAAKMAVKFLEENGRFIDLDEYRGILVTAEQLKEATIAHIKKKEAAGEHGTDAHELMEEYINKCLTEHAAKPEVLSFEPIGKFIAWAIENVDHFLYSERQMFDKKLFIAGTADFAYVGKDGKKYMADFKTSSGIYGIDYWLQVAAYRMLAEQEGDEPYDGATIVRMGKDGSFDAQQLYEYETYKEAFLCCLTLYRAQAAIKGLVVKQ